MKTRVLGLLAAMALLATLVLAAEPTLDDPVARLQRRIDSGAIQIHSEGGPLAYFAELLRYLDIDKDSQVLVFAKNSFQLAHINPKSPRAVFFNDSVSVGYVQNGDVFELAAVDPTQGAVFYTLDVHETEKPQFKRRGMECIVCHTRIGGSIPGFMVTSVYPAPDGTPAYLGTLFSIVDHRTPFEERWGGWYVTGTHGSMRHMGNAVALDPENKPIDLHYDNTQNVTDLADRFDVRRYPAPTSDLIALMTLEHQARMSNLIATIGQQYRYPPKNVTPQTIRQVNETLEDIVEYMVFADEALLKEPVRGVSTFAQTFPQRGPKDARGRSLRDFDLQRRVFKYPLSYMIYSEAFDRLPEEARARIYRRLYDVLSGRDTRPEFAGLSAERRQAAIEILRDTKSDLPEYWKANDD